MLLSGQKRAFFVIFTLLSLATWGRAETPAGLNIPRPDRAELMSVEPGATEGPKVALSAAKARKVLKLLHAFHWDGPAGACDKLQYVIRFYAKDKLIATDGICFHCGCFLALGDGNDAVSFDLQNTNTKALDTYLANFFPAGK